MVGFDLMRCRCWAGGVVVCMYTMNTRMERLDEQIMANSVSVQILICSLQPRTTGGGFVDVGSPSFFQKISDILYIDFIVFFLVLTKVIAYNETNYSFSKVVPVYTFRQAT